MPQQPRDIIRQYVIARLLGGDARGLTDDTDLFASGLLDSLRGLQILEFLERTFALTVEPEDVTPEAFRSVDAIRDFLEKARHGGDHGRGSHL